MLELKKVETAYGQSQVLYGIDLEVNDGEVVTLLGRNGMGKTTTIHSIMGLVKTRSGEIIFDGDHVQEWPAYRVARTGMGLVPEGRQIFPNLSVVENLVATAANRLKTVHPWTLGRVFKLFPRLTDRAQNMGNQLSGGEQQMLAIGRALMTNPKLLILDEATEGLAPLIRMEIWECLKGLKTNGQSILVVDKNIEALTHFADRHYIIEKGRVVWTGDSKLLSTNKEIQHRYLGI
ncbi:MAG: ABC transporter ATP-binding protein [SAR324 cluster bacterium]|nr:ABC transporter ATP-binding protein [SAR324 cluster bacterium]MDP6319223.1 ABC transporter ATP-binding protein [SAR324 cluster bacterium]MDP6886949.1 ABC transporter ATP-binding protein [SAR324 cluster bacterium]HJL93674.1 ABC transporter ATP-binding protein [SAR324 cluster bacterium]